MTTNTRTVNFYDLCRICMGHENKIKIFSEEGRNKSLQEKIGECLSLVVSAECVFQCEIAFELQNVFFQIDEKTDQLPKVICHNCLQQIEAIMEFRKTCKNSQVMLTNLISNISVSHNMTKPSVVHSMSVPKVVETPSVNPQLTQFAMPQTPQTQQQQPQQTQPSIQIPAGIQNNDFINSIMQGLQVNLV